MEKPQTEHLQELAETERVALGRIRQASGERHDRVRRALLQSAKGGGTELYRSSGTCGVGAWSSLGHQREPAMWLGSMEYSVQ